MLDGCPKICAGFFQRDRNFAVQTFRRKSQSRCSAKLSSDAAFDQFGAKAALPRIGDWWAALFDPVNLQNRSFVVEANRFPINFDATS